VKDRIKFGFFTKIAIICVIAFMLLKVTELNVKIGNLREAESELQKQVDMYELSIEELKEKLDQPLDEETIKRFAREKLNLRDPGDMLFVSDLPQ